MRVNHRRTTGVEHASSRTGYGFLNSSIEQDRREAG